MVFATSHHLLRSRNADNPYLKIQVPSCPRWHLCLFAQEEWWDFNKSSSFVDGLFLVQLVISLFFVDFWCNWSFHMLHLCFQVVTTAGEWRASEGDLERRGTHLPGPTARQNLNWDWRADCLLNVVVLEVDLPKSSKVYDLIQSLCTV